MVAAEVVVEDAERAAAVEDAERDAERAAATAAVEDAGAGSVACL